MNEGFLMDVYTAEMFFRFCRRYKIDDPKDRICLVRRLVSKKKAKYLRDVEQTIKGKKVLHIKPEDKKNV